MIIGCRRTRQPGMWGTSREVVPGRGRQARFAMVPTLKSVNPRGQGAGKAKIDQAACLRKATVSCTRSNGPSHHFNSPHEWGRLGAHEEIVVPRFTAGVRSSRWPSRPVRPRRYGQSKGCYGPTRLPRHLGGRRAAAGERAGTGLRVGWLSLFSASDPQFQRSVDLFRQTLRELGYVEGQSVAIEYRWAEGKSERLVELATELAWMKVDVIVADGGVPPAQAAQRATKTIPIVFSG